MPRFRVDIDERTLATASPARVSEWRALAEDLVEAIDSLDGREGSWCVGVEADRFTIASGAETLAIPRADLEPLFDEYLDVVTRLGSADEGGFSRVDALDMAKKVTHDRAGRVLKRALRPLGVDHEIARRVFSLLAALAHDTSGLTGVHAALSHPDR